MELPILQVSFRDIPPLRQDEIEERVRRRAEKLERFCDHITSCRVAVERPHRAEASGNPYRVRIDLTVPPGHEVVVRKEPGDNDPLDNLMTVVNGAFEAAERRLKSLVERQRGEVKTHEEPPALVTRHPPIRARGRMRDGALAAPTRSDGGPWLRSPSGVAAPRSR